MSLWYAVVCISKQEFKANVNLQKLGFDTWLPYEQVRRLRKGRYSRITEWRKEAFFPGYVFAMTDNNRMLSEVRSADGAVGLVRFGDEPLVIPQPVMDELMNRAEDDGLMQVIDKSARKRFKRGTIVRFSDDSPFRDFLAEIAADSGSHVVRVFIETLGRRQFMSVPPEVLSAAN